MASWMQDLMPGAGGDMLFSADLDTALAILDELSAHFWMPEVRAGLMPLGRQSRAR
jgi:hypothetical protein